MGFNWDYVGAKMRVLFSINHPAHYYLFKYAYHGLKEHGVSCDIVIKTKDILERILIGENVRYIKLVERNNSYAHPILIGISRLIELLLQDIRMYILVRRNKYRLLLGTDIAISHIGQVFGIPSIVFNEDDYDINKFFCKFAYPYATHIVSPEVCNVGNYDYKKISYNGIQKMAYLNKKYFNPDLRILKKYDLVENEYIIIRLVSLNAGHDIESKHSGISHNLLDSILKEYNSKYKIILNSEGKLPSKYEKYLLKHDPIDMHHIMAYAKLFIGDSQTMCAEAGILGCPFIRFNDYVGKIGYLDELENVYRLGIGIKTTQQRLLLESVGLMLDENSKSKMEKKVEKLYHDKDDLTSIIIQSVINYQHNNKFARGLNH
jgi:uncharacterized protein